MKEERVCLYEMPFQKTARVEFKNKSGANYNRGNWTISKSFRK
jgi:hypothetical protein